MIVERFEESVIKEIRKEPTKALKCVRVLSSCWLVENLLKKKDRQLQLSGSRNFPLFYLRDSRENITSMAGAVMKETKFVSAGEAQSQPNKAVAGGAQGCEVECAKCECCGLTEECTPTYISRIRERHQGRWICGLCAEAVKDEVLRSEERRIGTEEALNRHMNFCKKFRSAAPPLNPTEDLISAVKQLLLRCLESPRGVRSNPSSPMRKDEPVLARSTFGRSQRCFSTMDA